MNVLTPLAQTYSKTPDRFGFSLDTRITKAYGPYVYTSDGEQFVDLVSGLGAVILGHCDERVDARVLQQLSQGVAYPMPSQLEEQVAQRIIQYTGDWAECVRFAKNGADVTGAAVKLARHHTGHKLVGYLDYHGHHPWSMIEAPMNGGVHEPFSRRLNRNPEHILNQLHMYEFACIVLEPWPSNDPWFEYPNWFWQELREQCNETGTLIILAEMVSGFRCSLGGGREVLDIPADIVCYGKAMGNGHAVSAIVGFHEHFKHFEDHVFFSTTHGGEQCGLAAADATLVELVATDAHERIRNLGIEIIAECLRLGINVKYSYPQRLVFPEFGEEEKQIMAANGVLCGGYANLTLAHSAVADMIMNALEAVAKEI